MGVSTRRWLIFDRPMAVADVPLASIVAHLRVATCATLRLRITRRTCRPEGIRFLKRTRDQSLNPVSPDFVAPLGVRARVISATDETFDELVACHKGLVPVGFGPSWQVKWWEDVRRMLDVFAAKHAPRVKVLVLNIDECPTLAELFATNQVPVFKLLLRGELAKSYTGAHALPDLEREFAKFLS